MKDQAMQETVDRIIDQYSGEERHLLAVLQDIQGKYT